MVSADLITRGFVDFTIVRSHSPPRRYPRRGSDRVVQRRHSTVTVDPALFVPLDLRTLRGPHLRLYLPSEALDNRFAGAFETRHTHRDIRALRCDRRCGPRAGIGYVNLLSPDLPCRPRLPAERASFMARSSKKRRGVILYLWGIGTNVANLEIIHRTRRNDHRLIPGSPQPPAARDAATPRPGAHRRDRCRSRRRACLLPSHGA